MAGDPEKNWGLVALMAILVIAVFIMVFYSFKWGRPGDRYNDGTTPAGGTSAPEVSISAPPIITPPPAPVQ